MGRYHILLGGKKRVGPKYGGGPPKHRIRHHCFGVPSFLVCGVQERDTSLEKEMPLVNPLLLGALKNTPKSLYWCKNPCFL